MPVKTKKELQNDYSEMKERLNIFKVKFDKLSEEHKTLQAELIIEKEKNKNRCKNSDKSFETTTNMKKHENDKDSKTRVFKCDHCDSEFKEKWKMNAHLKQHEKHKCEQCGKTFKYQDIKKKHVLVSHENVKLYCHFYNNEKTCPFDESCIFLHEDAKICRYDEMCERNLCMFKHRKKIGVPGPSEPVDIIDAIENISESVVDEEDVEIDRDETTVNENANTTFFNPSQLVDKSSETTFKCEQCDFITGQNIYLTIHKEEIHNWCVFCFSNFKTQELLKNHTKTIHNNGV